MTDYGPVPSTMADYGPAASTSTSADLITHRLHEGIGLQPYSSPVKTGTNIRKDKMKKPGKFNIPYNIFNHT
jgi:hypothetical protein